MIRISLTEKDFTDLVQGKTIKKHEGEEPVEICLHDIGYYRIALTLDKAIINFNG